MSGSVTVHFGFDADMQGFVASVVGNPSPNGCTVLWDNRYGSQAPGCLEVSSGGTTLGSATGQFVLTTTAEALGVPAGATITGVVSPSLMMQCNHFSGSQLFGQCGLSMSAPNNSFIGLIQDFPVNKLYPWTQFTGGGHPSLNHFVAGDTITITLSMPTSWAPNDWIMIGVDDIELTFNYE